jgi:integrase
MPRKSSTGTPLEDALVRTLPAPDRGARITYDTGPDKVSGFGIRVTASGAKSFVLNYVVSGRERRMTIGSYPAWKVAVARKEAERLRREIDQGNDPLGQKQAERDAPTVNELADRYLDEWARPRKRSGPAKADEVMLERYVRPEIGKQKVKGIAYEDIDRLHRKMSKATPHQANRVLALLSKMFSLAVLWQMRAGNPTKGVQRNHEEPRYRYLSGDELRRLTEALAVHPSEAAANAVRLLLLTGARRGEVLGSTWDQFGLKDGTWTKPSAHTKQKKNHRVPLSAPARQLLAEMKADAERRTGEKGELSPRVFPSSTDRGIHRSWVAICRAAGIEGVRIHDLRHHYASILASAGLGLPVIGALLGHTQPGTTARYAHLFDDPLRAATERVGAIVTGKDSGGEVVSIERRR